MSKDSDVGKPAVKKPIEHDITKPKGPVDKEGKTVPGKVWSAEGPDFSKNVRLDDDSDTDKP